VQMILNPIQSSSRAMFAALAAAWICFGCASAPIPEPPTAPLPLEQAAALAADRLIAQVSAKAGWLASWSSESLVVQPLSDPRSGQETAASASAATLIERRIAVAHPRFEALPFRAPGIGQARYLVSGTIGRIAAGADAAALTLRATDLRTGATVGQTSVPVQSQGMDDTPLAAYRDSPLILRVDPVPAERPEGKAREQLLAAARLDEAATAYAAGRWTDALASYDAALAAPGGDTLRVHAGRYLALTKLGRDADADAAFARMIALALGSRSIGVKFLFRPGTTEFWPDPQVSGAYGRWLEVIARQTAALKACLDVVGHTSHTGTVEFNEKLSLQRAAAIKQRLQSAASELDARTTVSGMGWRENLVGSGTDDARDAVDRRVEFKVVACR
jgi:outer membrane protein OmpA-like peptidoglycan-associated protein